MPAAVMPCSVPEMKMMRHMQMNVQRAAQKRECGIGEADDKTDQIKNFPVHTFTSLNLAPPPAIHPTLLRPLRPHSFPWRSSAAADAARAAAFPPVPGFPESLP